MAARWPYGVALAFVIVALVGLVFAPFAALGYIAVIPLGLITWYAFSRGCRFRWVIGAAFLIQVAGLTAFLLAGLTGLAYFNRVLVGGEAATASFIATEIVGFIAFLGLLPLPWLGAITGIVGLGGALARPGVQSERAPLEPVGSVG